MYEDIGEREERSLQAMQASTATFLEQAIPAGIFRGWVAETGAGRVVAGGGMMIVPWLSRPADPEPRRAWILNVYTDPAYRRRGIARRLMLTLIEWCRQAGFQSVSLHASDEGRPLYESLGFRPTQEMKLVKSQNRRAPGRNRALGFLARLQPLWAAAPGTTMGEHPGSGPVMNITTACDSWPTPADAALAIILGLFDKFAEVF